MILSDGAVTWKPLLNINFSARINLLITSTIAYSIWDVNILTSKLLHSLWAAGSVNAVSQEVAVSLNILPMEWPFLAQTPIRKGLILPKKKLNYPSPLLHNGTTTVRNQAARLGGAAGQHKKKTHLPSLQKNMHARTPHLQRPGSSWASEQVLKQVKGKPGSCSLSQRWEWHIPTSWALY